MIRFVGVSSTDSTLPRSSNRLSVTRLCSSGNYPSSLESHPLARLSLAQVLIAGPLRLGEGITRLGSSGNNLILMDFGVLISPDLGVLVSPDFGVLVSPGFGLLMIPFVGVSSTDSTLPSRWTLSVGRIGHYQSLVLWQRPFPFGSRWVLPALVLWQ